MTGVCEHGASFNGSETTTLWCISSAGAMLYPWFAYGTVLCSFDDWVSTWTDYKRHGANLHSAWKMLWIYLSVSNVPNRKLTARSTSTSNHTRMWRSPFWSCGRITPFASTSSLFAIMSFRNLRLLTHDSQVGCTENPYIKFGPAPLSIWHLNTFWSAHVGPL